MDTINTKEFGDFQTPDSLANRTVAFLSAFLQKPDIVLEPTAGIGNFIAAAEKIWGDDTVYCGFERNEDYVCYGQDRFASQRSVSLRQQDFFSYEWSSFFAQHANKKILILGNPPWVTNASLGVMGSQNLPDKNNFQGLRGFEAKTGKSNFDIAEWILIQLIATCHNPDTTLAMLCKTATARKVLKHFWASTTALSNVAIHLIDAKKEFNVSVDACLFVVTINSSSTEKHASIYPALSNKNKTCRFGLHHGEMISDLDAYLAYRDLDGMSNYRWRSGVKHDASKVMEFNASEMGLRNGFGDTVDIEDDLLYPLLKSSDVANGRFLPRKRVLITQRRVGEATGCISENTPRTWKYLCNHAEKLDGRRSSIYQKRARFSIFGIGDYSFSRWKVAISGLYKSLRFLAVPSHGGKPTMLDDTCYFISCDSEEEAKFWEEQLNSDTCQRFLHSLVFFDAKRPINVDILKRISFRVLAVRNGVLDEAIPYLEETSIESSKQAQFAFEEKTTYSSRAQ